MTDYPWRDKQRLEKEYRENGKSSVQLAGEWDCAKQTVLNWLHKFDIQTRKENKHKPPSFHTKPSGYERWSTQHSDKHFYVYVHRLLAVSEYGYKAVVDGVVHHKNTIRWDNRPDNIDVFATQSEHGKHHEAKRERPQEPWHDSEVLQELYIEQEMSTREIADHLGCCKWTVQNWLHRLDIPTRPSNSDGEVI